MNEIDIIKTIFAFYVLGDWKGAQALIHPDAEIFFPGDPSILPWAGGLKGSDNRKFFDAVKDHLDFLEYSILAFHQAGTAVVVQARERVRVRRTGRLVTNEHLGIARVREGRMVAYREYADTAALQAGFTE